MTGIDISGVQPPDVPGNWEFIVVKSTENLSVVNPLVNKQWANAARTTRGLYHYARPLLSSPTAQAQVFCADALQRGFKPGVDLWQLDAEDGENAGVGNWYAFIVEFMDFTLTHLGPRGFLYAGWPFLVTHGCQALNRRYKWWLPAYGNNDGQIYPFPPGVDPSLVVIHQYTSHGSLDQNRIVDPVKYGQAPAPAPSTPSKDRDVFFFYKILGDPSDPHSLGIWKSDGFVTSHVPSPQDVQDLAFLATACGVQGAFTVYPIPFALHQTFKQV